MTATDAYAELVRRGRDLAVINSCAAVLGWDQQTYMPRNGAGLRGDQIAWLAGLAHARGTDPKIGELLAAVEGTPVVADPDSPEAANVREWRHGYDRATKLPGRLVEELARVTTAAQQAWQDAKTTSNYPLFQPHLEKVLALKREEADAVGYKAHRYDALLDEYEPGATAAELKDLFAELSKELVPLIVAVQSSPRQPKREILERDYPVDRQRVFAEAAAAAVGFDFAAGRLDTTSHPFCSGFGPGDCRITTRFNPKFFPEAFFGVLHETGHGLYEQNLPADRFGEPCGSYCSLGIHESQSRLWENQVGRGRAFWGHFFPRLKQTFPTTLADATEVDFVFAVNDVRPSFIRVEADEATYNLHIALRFELELALLTGDLTAADLPGAWNERFHALFGLTVPDDRRGCLQDIHWSFGGVGYFPTYTLGNLLAAQFMAAARKQLGAETLDEAFRRGDYSLLKDWLIANIHSHGRRFRAGDLCRRVTGAPLSSQAFLSSLREKYAARVGMC
ncbi:MAG TPA: carboxypeptidase M32 [Fimbriiglobus sp.]|jgi:carboxypeptidase Taq